MDIVLVYNDCQTPYHDPYALSVVEQVMKYVKPTLVLNLGDFLDFPGLSTKFRRTPDQRHRLVADIKVGKELLLHHRTLAPKAEYIYIEGNHEARLRNYVVDLADELAAFTDDAGILSLPALLRLDTLGIQYLGPYGEAYVHDSFVFKHGDRITKHAAASELMAEGSSGMSGHTHHLGSYFVTNRSGAHVWYENGCLCNVVGANRPPAAINSNGPYNWQQGFSLVYFERGMFNVNQVAITNGRCILEGKVIEGRAR